MFFKVNFFSSVRTGLPPEFIRKIIKQSLKKLKVKKGGEISLVFTDEKTIRRLNKKYRKKNKPTNILSFVFADKKNFVSPSSQGLKGEIIICPAQAKREAKKEGISLRSKITLLIVHGLLHLFGFDHKNKNQREKMEAKEKELINSAI